jgi:hypothetical protein
METFVSRLPNAIREGDTSVVKVVLSELTSRLSEIEKVEYFKSSRPDAQRSAFLAVCAKNYEAAHTLFAEGTLQTTFFHAAVACDDPEVFERLAGTVVTRAPPSHALLCFTVKGSVSVSHYMTALRDAAAHGASEVLRWLLVRSPLTPAAHTHLAQLINRAIEAGSLSAAVQLARHIVQIRSDAAAPAALADGAGVTIELLLTAPGPSPAASPLVAAASQGRATLFLRLWRLVPTLATFHADYADTAREVICAVARPADGRAGRAVHASPARVARDTAIVSAVLARFPPADARRLVYDPADWMAVESPLRVAARAGYAPLLELFHTVLTTTTGISAGTTAGAEVATGAERARLHGEFTFIAADMLREFACGEHFAGPDVWEYRVLDLLLSAAAGGATLAAVYADADVRARVRALARDWENDIKVARHRPCRFAGRELLLALTLPLTLPEDAADASDAEDDDEEEEDEDEDEDEDEEEGEDDEDANESAEGFTDGTADGSADSSATNTAGGPAAAPASDSFAAADTDWHRLLFSVVHPGDPVGAPAVPVARRNDDQDDEADEAEAEAEADEADHACLLTAADGAAARERARERAQRRAQRLLHRWYPPDWSPVRGPQLAPSPAPLAPGPPQDLALPPELQRLRDAGVRADDGACALCRGPDSSLCAPAAGGCAALRCVDDQATALCVRGIFTRLLRGYGGSRARARRALFAPALASPATARARALLYRYSRRPCTFAAAVDGLALLLSPAQRRAVFATPELSRDVHPRLRETASAQRRGLVCHSIVRAAAALTLSDDAAAAAASRLAAAEDLATAAVAALCAPALRQAAEAGARVLAGPEPPLLVFARAVESTGVADADTDADGVRVRETHAALTALLGSAVLEPADEGWLQGSLESVLSAQRHGACALGNAAALIELLLRSGADPHIRGDATAAAPAGFVCAAASDCAFFGQMQWPLAATEPLRPQGACTVLHCIVANASFACVHDAPVGAALRRVIAAVDDLVSLRVR